MISTRSGYFINKKLRGEYVDCSLPAPDNMAATLLKINLLILVAATIIVAVQDGQGKEEEIE